MPDLVEKLFDLLLVKEKILVTAESCTGGLIAAAITDRAGSSIFFERGFVTYANKAKIEMLDVPLETLEKHGAVSFQTAEDMVTGALKNSDGTIAVSATGIAGPGGGTETKPVGRIYIAVGIKDSKPQSFEHNFTGDREEIRLNAVGAALYHLIDLLEAQE